MSSGLDWTFAWAVEAGKGKTEAQDACLATTLPNGAVAVAAADGAGSTVHGGVGARIACEVFGRSAGELLELATDDEIRSRSRAFLADTLAEISAVAAEADRPISDFATTFVGVVADESRVVTVQIGDGAAVAGLSDGLALIAKPMATEFVNVTRFLTDKDAEDRLVVEVFPQAANRICAFTDGLQPLIVDERTQEPHAPFFERVFSVLVGASEEPFDERASAWLSKMLSGDPVQKRTDDDTSIVVARRLP